MLIFEQLIKVQTFTLFFVVFFLGEAQIRVAVEVAEQFIALTGKSKEYVRYDGVINRNVLKHYGF